MDLVGIKDDPRPVPAPQGPTSWRGVSDLGYDDRMVAGSLRYTADHPDGLVLGDVDSSTYYSRWDRIQERANLPRGRRWKTHVLRHTIATLTVICGGDPSAILRHSDPRVAREAYVDISRTAKPGSQIVAGLLGFMQSPDEVNREAAT
jgi:hypothetical protein